MSLFGTANKKDKKSDSQIKSLASKFIIGLIPVIIFVLLWQIAPGQGWVDPIYVSTPYDIHVRAIGLLQTGELTDNIIISMGRIVAALIMAIVIGVPLGLVLGGLLKNTGKFLKPLFLLFMFANPFTLLVLFIVLLGFNETTRVLIIFTVAVWPILFHTLDGIRDTDPELVKLARSFGLSKFQIFTRVMLRSAVPAVFSGIRIAVLLSFFVLIGAEMIGANSGLGFMINNSCPLHGTSELDKMWVGIVTVALLGAAMSWILTTIEKRIAYKKEGSGT
ncbi:MAG: ABC transporter permease [Candidatus Methanoplasma sp.]|jgi:NitT/TauT family transport system permease protein|nr:ABC transporter permease [Candidatus Methanoplasma sp.]